jgi:hypothetical protein
MHYIDARPLARRHLTNGQVGEFANTGVDSNGVSKFSLDDNRLQITFSDDAHVVLDDQRLG